MQRTAKRPPNKPLLHNETAHAAARVGSRPRRSRSLPSSVAQARCCSALWQRPGPEPGWQHMDMALARERWSCSRHSSSGGSGRESVGDEEPHRFAGAGGRDRSGVRRRHGIGHPKRRTGRGPARLLYLGTERSAEELTRRLLRAAGIGLVVSASFVILFGAAGLVVAATTSGVVRYFPWIGLVVGVLLVAAGAATLGGVSPQLGILDRLGDRAGAIAKRGGIAGYAAYGIAYAAGSLGCTLPIFLSVVAAGMTTRGPAGALLQFVLYGLGMGSVLSALTLAAALVGHGAVRKVRRVGAYLQPVGAVVLLLAGGYVVYYWLTAGGIASSIG